MSDPILENLNPQQLEAVTAADGPLLIVAGAGSGKTRVITRRIAHLVCSRGIRPFEIFAATFTNKAAAEMKHRVAQLTGSISVSDFHIATFHSLCVRILRRESAAAGLTRSFTICDDRDQISAIRHVMRKLGIPEKQLKPADAQHVINQCKMRMLGPEEVHQVTSSSFEEMYGDIYGAYDAYLRANAAVDFEDLILHVVRLFRQNPEILQAYQRRYRHVMVDEYQDTNAVQFELVRLMAQEHRNLTVVGDEDQSIYSWRGADISNLLDFQKHFPDARLVRLEQNYRSTGNILEAAASVISRNTQRLGKNLFTEGPDGEPVYFMIAGQEFEETSAVVETIEHLVQSGRADYSDCAIFYRMSALSRGYEDRLRQHNIPYRVIGGIRFYDRAEIKDLISYLQVVNNPANALALLRIVNTPKRGLGEKSLQMVLDYAHNKSVSEFEALAAAASEKKLPRAAAGQAQRFVEQVRKWRDFSKSHRISELLQRILDETAYVESLGDPDSMEVRARGENIQELLSAIVEFERQNPFASLQDYLENVSLVSAVDVPGGEPAVSMMTLHAAKGLEFKVVFMVGLEESIFPNPRAVVDQGDLEEERRLFYVGVTRARDMLILTRSESRILYGDLRMNAPSCFLKELPEEVMAPLDAIFGRVSEQVIAQPVAAPASSRPSPARTRKAPEAPAYSSNGIELGRRVRHPLLGEGIITGMSGSGNGASLLVQMDDGKTHRLLARYANLQMIEE